MHEKNKAEAGAVRQTEELNPEWHTSGCIIHNGKVHLVTAHISLLIMQTRLYAEMQASTHERDSKTATTESARLLMVRIARDLRRWATDDPAFLESSTSIWQCSISLAVRSKLGFLSVTEDNFGDYVAEVLAHSLPARKSIPPTFLLLTGPGQPELFVTQESAHLAQFAGEWVFRQVVSPADLKRLYNRVAEDYPAENRRAGGNQPDQLTSEKSLGQHLLDSLESGVLHPALNLSKSPKRLKRRTPQKQNGSGKKQDGSDEGGGKTNG